MVKLKRRYLLIELLFTDNENREVTGADLYHAIVDHVALLHGDFGVGAISGSFQV